MPWRRWATSTTGAQPDNASRRAHGFGLVLTDAHNPGLAELAMALEDASAEAGSSLVMGFTRDDLQKQTDIIRSMMEYRLDGIVLSPARGTSVDDLLPMARSKVPHVLVTRRLHGYQSDYVGPNNMMAGRLLADHMASLGATAWPFWVAIQRSLLGRSEPVACATSGGSSAWNGARSCRSPRARRSQAAERRS